MTSSDRRAPKLGRHKQTGHAYAKFDGRQFWFGPYDAPETHERFARALVAWRVTGHPQAPQDFRGELTVADIVARYLEFAERYYCGPDGSPTREIANVRDAVRPLLVAYGTLPVAELGVRELKIAREQLIVRGLARTTINDRMNRIVRIVRWAAEEELCEPKVVESVRVLRPLRRGRTRAKESRRVQPVDREHCGVQGNSYQLA